MTNKEKQILKAVREHPEGLLSPSTLINGIAGQDQRSVQHLVSRDYLEEVPRDIPDFHGTHIVNFYRITEKGLTYFEPWYKKILIYAKGDIRTIIVSVITALIISILSQLLLKK